MKELKMVLSKIALCALGFVMSAEAFAAENTIMRFVAPKAMGSGDGTTEKDAALYTDPAFWERVRADLEKQPVEVKFLQGEYVSGVLELKSFGHPEHILVIEGSPQQGTVFRILSEKDRPYNTGFHLSGCQNVTVKNLHFTGQGYIGYISTFNGTYILVENCSWIDLPHIRYGSTGTSRGRTHHVTFRNCTFKRVGVTGGAHMSYNAYGPHHLRFADCYFEDCSGDFVRFRDRTDYCVVERCTFKSTGTWPPESPVHRAFIAVPLFADANPGDEWFGTHFVIRDNKFTYEDVSAGGARIAIRFSHSGYDPPELHHLMTPEDGAILEKGTPEQKKALLKKNCNIDTNEVLVFDNEYNGVENRATFSSGAAYGAESKGWESMVDIFDLLNHTKSTPGWEAEMLEHRESSR